MLNIYFVRYNILNTVKIALKHLNLMEKNLIYQNSLIFNKQKKNFKVLLEKKKPLRDACKRLFVFH